jgi:hypothetical protein
MTDGAGKSGSRTDHGNARSIRAALDKMAESSELISQMIREERHSSNDEQTLEGLYTVKGALTCAIEETQAHIAR